MREYSGGLVLTQDAAGDILRYRQVRLECLVQSAAAYVTSFLGAYVSANSTPYTDGRDMLHVWKMRCPFGFQFP